MKNLHVLLMVSLLTCAGGVAIAQDYDAGLKAAQAGDFQTALKEWKPLADQGHAGAQYNLGLMYASGEGVPEDDAEAVRWFRLAADQGHADAQNNLGVMYDNGEGVPEDDAEAAGWYRLAADQGLADAQNNLGWMYANGEGVLQDNVTAHMWFNIAGANGDEDGRDNREKIEWKMTPADISEAQKRARIYMASIEIALTTVTLERDARLADVEVALAAALLARDTFATQLESAVSQQADTASRLASVETALAAALLARDTLTAKLLAAEDQQIETASRLASADDALAAELLLREQLRASLQDEALRRGNFQARLKAVEIALTTITQERDALLVRIENSDADSQTVSARLTSAQEALAVALAEADALRAGLGDEDELRKLLASALAAKLAAEQQSDSQMTAAEQRDVLLATAKAALSREEALSAEGLRKVALLNEQIAAVRAQLGSLASILDAADARHEDSQVEITNLSARLNAALARVASEERRRARLEEAERIRLEEEARQLARYRSEFFGEIREILGDREGVRIVGDRFVFSSEVLFESASTKLADGGKAQIERVVQILDDVAGAIPPEIDWVIRVDGHTDTTALSGTGRYRDNWELSQARALSVVRYMTEELGFPATRLAATGFGEFQPVALGDSPEALAQNRRIELKLTER